MRFRPIKRAIQHIDAARNKRVQIGFVFGVVGIIRAENPVTERNAHGVDAACREPSEILLSNPCVPVCAQFFSGSRAEFRAPSGFIGGGHTFKQTRHHPFFQYQPAAKIYTAHFFDRSHAVLLDEKGMTSSIHPLVNTYTGSNTTTGMVRAVFCWYSR